MNGFFVYIIRNACGRHYIGHTQNLKDRITRHNSDRSKYTKNKGPWEIIVTYKLKTKSEAYQLEMKLKRMKNSSKAINYIKNLGSVVEHSDR